MIRKGIILITILFLALTLSGCFQMLGGALFLSLALPSYERDLTTNDVYDVSYCQAQYLLAKEIFIGGDEMIVAMWQSNSNPNMFVCASVLGGESLKTKPNIYYKQFEVVQKYDLNSWWQRYKFKREQSSAPDNKPAFNLRANILNSCISKEGPPPEMIKNFTAVKLNGRVRVRGTTFKLVTVPPW